MLYLDYDEEEEDFSQQKTNWGLKGISAIDLSLHIKEILHGNDINPHMSNEKEREIAQRGKPITVTVKK